MSVQGVVELRDDLSTAWRAVGRDDAICAGYRLRVQDNSRVSLQLDNGTFLRLGANSSVRFPPPADERPGDVLELLQGIAHFISRLKRRLEIDTPFLNAAVEGTEFTVQVDDAQAQVTVLEGRVTAHNKNGSVVLADGESVISHGGAAPLLQAGVHPRDAVHWALYYPAIIRFDETRIAAGLPADTAAAIRDSLGAYRRGDIAAAFSALDSLDSPPRTHDYLAWRASLALAVGDSATAREAIGRALELQPGDADALALRSLIAVVEDRVTQALADARRAVDAAPSVAAPHIALSYALQAAFRIDAATAAAQRAVSAEPGNALAHARLAELRLMSGDLDGTRQSAGEAVRLDPQLAHAHTVQGFAELMRLDGASARRSFDTAIALDQAAPLPRLGLGLVLIGAGHLRDGRRQMEIAASLDPGHALVRSYLGKAYFEERRDGPAAAQYGLARDLDPRDPTAWLYNAILEQSRNRPAAALADLEAAAALNDNRAVYRSRLLLDEDRAANDASQARVYGDLGFERLGLVEAWKSLETDAGNHSAHRFLADSYNGQARLEIARVSEGLQAQLLQAAPVLPVRPSAQQTRLLAFEDTGPSTPAFSEFSPLFNRKRASLLASGVRGSDDTRGGELAAGFISTRGMISAGHYRQRSDGVRDNNDSDQSIDNVFAQYRLSSALSVQAEHRNRNGEFGDMKLRIDDSFTDERRDIDDRSWRFGANYTPSPAHTVLVSAIKLDLVDEVSQGPVTVNTDDSNMQYELQYIHNGAGFDATLGAGRVDLDREVTATFSVFGFPVTDITRPDVEQRTANVYFGVPLLGADWTLGVDYAAIDEEGGIDIDRFNPKMGLMWSGRRTTVRLAAFRTLRTELANSLTIAPTRVAGFNQLFDDTLGSSAWRYGAGLDYRFDEDLSAGLEASARNVSELFIQVPGNAVLRDDRDEREVRAYLYWLPDPRLALSAEYRYDTYRRNGTPGQVDISRPARETTHALPLQARVFHDSGLFAGLTATYVDQEVRNFVVPAGTQELQDDFWVADLTLGYRLPRRRGIVEASVRNLLDTAFSYQSSDPGTGTPLASPYYPDRAGFVTVQLWF